MKKVLLFAASIFCLLLTTGLGIAAVDGMHRGKVDRVLHSGGYTYVQYKERGAIKWVASQEDRRLRKGDSIEFPLTPPMVNFESKTLKMKFKELEFYPTLYATRKGKALGLPPSPAVRKDSELDADPKITREEFDREIQLLLSDQKNLDEMNPFPAGSTLQPIYTRFIKEIATDKIIVDFLYKSFSENADLVKDQRVFTNSLVAEYTSRGLVRLSERDFEEMLRLLNVLASKVSAEDCANLVRQGNNFKDAWLNHLTTEDATLYLRLAKKALVNEINQSPMLPLNTAEQKKMANEALISELRRRLKPEQLEVFGRVWKNMELADDEELCWGSRVLFVSILSLPAASKRWMLQEFASYIRPPE